MRAQDSQGSNSFASALERLLHQVLLNRSRLDAALSRAEPALKGRLAVAAGQVLRRPDRFTADGRIPWTGFAPGASPEEEREARIWIKSVSVAASRDAAAGEGRAAAAFPPAILAEWSAGWGESKSRELAGVLTEAAATTLRVVRRADPAELAIRLAGEADPSLELHRTRHSPVGLRAEGYAPVLGTAAYGEGLFEIQDEGSQVMSLFALWPDVFAPLLARSPGRAPADATVSALPRWDRDGWTVVDACAGAGGKSLAMADLLGGRGRVFGYDVAPTKVSALKRRAKRLRLNNIQAVLLPEGDERSRLERFVGTADVVLVDAPCTGWGVLRRNPDIKFHQSMEERERLEALQFRLLETYSMLVRPGGRLVYGLCTFRPEETSEQVARFLAAHPEFLAGPSGYFGPSRESDGFYMASMQRVEASR